MKNIETLDMSGDVGLKVRGSSLEELFANAASGMSELITDTRDIAATEEREISLKSDSLEDLLILWLNELIFLFDRDGFIGKSFNLNLEGNTLTAKTSGGIFDPEINEKRLLLKAATYHKLSLKKMNSVWEAVVVFDI
ncbi:MAG: archease [Nitrospirae bacterium]|nr:archease [Nitrospirota bacterium]